MHFFSLLFLSLPLLRACVSFPVLLCKFCSSPMRLLTRLHPACVHPLLLWFFTLRYLLTPFSASLRIYLPICYLRVCLLSPHTYLPFYFPTCTYICILISFIFASAVLPIYLLTFALLFHVLPFHGYLHLSTYELIILLPYILALLPWLLSCLPARLTVHVLAVVQWLVRGNDPEFLGPSPAVSSRRFPVGG